VGGVEIRSCERGDNVVDEDGKIIRELSRDLGDVKL
jgi:hypothetical protein